MQKNPTLFVILSFILISNIYGEETNTIKKEKDWGLETSAGFSFSSGNSEKIGLNTSLTFKKFSETHELLLKGSYYYGESKGEKDINKWDGTIMYDFNFLKSESLFLFVFPAGNEFQDLYLRLQSGAGYKHTFYNKKGINLSISLAGLWEFKYSYAREDDHISRLSFRPKIKIKPNDSFYLYFVLFYQPEIDYWLDYRIMGEFKMDFRIIKFLFFEVKLIDEYNNIVPENIIRNDFTIINALKFKI